MDEWGSNNNRSSTMGRLTVFRRMLKWKKNQKKKKNKKNKKNQDRATVLSHLNKEIDVIIVGVD